MNDYVVFAKQKGGELMRFLAQSVSTHTDAMDLVRAEYPGAIVMVDLSLTRPTTEQKAAA